MVYCPDRCCQEMLRQGLSKSPSHALLQSLHYPQIINITAVKTTATIIHHCVRFFCSSIGRVFVAFIGK